MNVLIKNYTIPKHCYVCPFRSGDTCSITHSFTDREDNTRLNDCPMEEKTDD